MSAEYDARFPTNNTNLAACLGGLQIPIKSVSAVQHDTLKTKIVTYFFEEAGQPFLGKTYDCATLEWGWRHREEFEAKNPAHPLIPMRKALQQRDWIVKVIKGRAELGFSDGKKVGFTTSSIAEAACANASGSQLLAIDMSGTEPLYRLTKPREGFQADYANYNTGDGKASNVGLMRRSCEVHALLLEKLVKKCPVSLYVTGPFEDGFKNMFIPEGTDDETRELLEDYYNDL